MKTEQFVITLFGKPIGKPMPLWLIERKLERLSFCVKGLSCKPVEE